MTMSSPTSRLPLPILALALAAFAIGTTEFVIMGILPDVARDLGVSIPSAGLLVTGYALGVAVGAPLLAAITARWPPKATLITACGPQPATAEALVERLFETVANPPKKPESKKNPPRTERLRNENVSEQSPDFAVANARRIEIEHRDKTRR